ncbi:MAG: hypothetical protein HC896_11860, partial [Bacteroidales bacterium]|nr:hypothetical protein [Bacteroidales bacterium]
NGLAINAIGNGKNLLLYANPGDTSVIKGYWMKNYWQGINAQQVKCMPIDNFINAVEIKEGCYLASINGLRVLLAYKRLRPKEYETLTWPPIDYLLTPKKMQLDGLVANKGFIELSCPQAVRLY